MENMIPQRITDWRQVCNGGETPQDYYLNPKSFDHLPQRQNQVPPGYLIKIIFYGFELWSGPFSEQVIGKNKKKDKKERGEKSRRKGRGKNKKIMIYLPRKSLKKLNKSSGDDSDDSLQVKWSLNQWSSSPPISLNWVISSSSFGSKISSQDYKKKK